MATESFSKDSVLALGRAPVDTADERAVLEGIACRWLKAQDQARWPRALQFFENASYLQGNHLTRYFYAQDGTLGSTTFGQGQNRNRYDSLIARSVDNRLIRPFENMVAMLVGPRPSPRVEPNSEHPDDQDAAALGEVIVSLFFENPVDLPSLRREIATAYGIFGTAIVESEYGETDDPVVIPKIALKSVPNPVYENMSPAERSALTDEDRLAFGPDEMEVEEEVGEEVVFRRDAKATVWTPLHITPDPMATSPKNMVWVARSSFVDKDYIRERYDVEEEGYFPEALDGMHSESPSTSPLYWYARLQDIIEAPQYALHGGGLTTNPMTATGAGPNEVLFTIIDVKPTKDFPRGRTLVLAGGKLIYAGDARAWSERYPWRWHPYAFGGWFKVTGKFWHVPLLSFLVPIQKRINAIDALVHANRMYISIGQWLLPKHSKLAEGRISGFPGEHYTYTDVPGMHAPERVPNQPLTGDLLNERVYLIEALNDLATSGALGGASGEVAASAARAGVIFDFLRNEKLRSKSAMVQEYEKLIETIGQNLLLDVQLNVAAEDPELTQRIRRAARDHSNLQIATFTGESLRDHHAVKIDIADEMMRSPEAQESRAIEFLQARGAGASPSEVDIAMRASGMARFMKSKENASTMRARRMVARIIGGRLEAALPMVGIDVPSVMAPVFQEAILADAFVDHPGEVQQLLLQMFELYQSLTQQEMMNAQKQQLMLAQAYAQATGKPPKPAQGGGPE